MKSTIAKLAGLSVLALAVAAFGQETGASTDAAHATKTAAKKTAHATKKAATATADATTDAAKDTGTAAKKTGHAVNSNTRTKTAFFMMLSSLALSWASRTTGPFYTVKAAGRRADRTKG